MIIMFLEGRHICIYMYATHGRNNSLVYFQTFYDSESEEDDDDDEDYFPSSDAYIESPKTREKRKISRRRNTNSAGSLVSAVHAAVFMMCYNHINTVVRTCSIAR